MVDTPIRTLMCITRAILLPLKFMSASWSPQKRGNYSALKVNTSLSSVQLYSMYICCAMYPQAPCTSLWHSRKRLAKVSIFTLVFRLFPLIAISHLCPESSYSMGFSRTYAHFNFYYKPKENLFSQIRTIGKSPLSRFSYAPAATSKGGGLYIP